MIDLSLVLARHHERDRLVEPEVWAAVEGNELAPVQDEVDGHRLTSPIPSRVRRHLANARVWEDPGIEVRRLLALGVEPQTCGERVHHSLLIAWSSRRPIQHRPR